MGVSTKILQVSENNHLSMKTLLFTLSLLISTLAISQNSEVYNQEWYQSLEEPINFITFKEPCKNTLQLRVYRGNQESYTLRLYNTKGIEVLNTQVGQSDEIDISRYYQGVYQIRLEDNQGNAICKEVVIG